MLDHSPVKGGPDVPSWCITTLCFLSLGNIPCKEKHKKHPCQHCTLKSRTDTIMCAPQIVTYAVVEKGL